MAQDKANKTFNLLSEKLIKEHWDFYPTAGSRIGHHQYDGRLPDLSPAQNARRVLELKSGQKELQRINSEDLSDAERMSSQMLDLFLQRELFVFNDLKPLENNPMRHIGYLNVSGYIHRNYAPLDDRLRAASRTMRQVPDFLNV